jgi:peptidoglycan/LPS O-acetylase OafA/YrhL
LYPNAPMGFWSHNGLKHDYYITQLPIIRLLYTGTVMVFIFFVLSGFSITLKPLKLARQGASNLLYNNLVSATFRRAVRLYFPCVALMLLVLLQTYFGCFQYAETVVEDWPFMKKQVPESLRLKSGQVWHLCQSMWQWSDPVCIASPPVLGVSK